MKTGLDMDGCFANFNNGFIDAANDIGKLNIPYYGEYQHPHTWDYYEEIGIPRKVVREVWDDIIRRPDFWVGLEPLPGAHDAAAVVNDLVSDGHQFIFITHRPDNAHRYTVEWLEDIGVVNPQVIVTSVNKVTLGEHLHLDAMVEDHPETLADLDAWRRMTGSRKLYRHIVGVRRDYNAQVQRTSEYIHWVPNIDKALHYIEGL